MKLKYVTITGVDERTDLDRLQELGQKYPFAEFGVLLSYDWSVNGHRFPHTDILRALKGRGLNLSAHFCGKMAIDVMNHDLFKVYNVGKGYLDIFRRCQLNLNASGHFDELRKVRPFLNIEEIIIQMHYPEFLERFLEGELPNRASYLLDASAGRGIDTPIRIVTHPNVHVGYAGGISPDNVETKLRTLLDHESDDVFWIDMETLVRTEDEWLDLDKVERVLSICDQVLKQYDNPLAK